MLQHRAEIGSRKPDLFGIKEANPVLAKVVGGFFPNATPGLVQALLDNGANICIERPKSNSLLKRLTGKDQVDVPSNLLAQATRTCTEDILIVLAQHADERCLNEALPAAISQGDTGKTAILLARGADASGLCALFLDAVQCGSDEMVELLLGRVGGACQTCRDKGLVRAAKLGYEAKVQALLKKGADATKNDAEAILGASHAAKEMIAVEIVSSAGGRLKPIILDTILGQAYSRQQYRLVTKCLQEGARGTNTDSTLAMAVERNQTLLVDELIRHGASVSNNGNALGLAVQSGRCDLVQKILQCRPPQSILADAMAKTASLTDIRIVYGMIDLLLFAGLQGKSVSEALIKVADKASMPGDDGVKLQVLQLLLNKGAADINLHDGRCIGATISSGCSEMLPLLLRNGPSLKSLSAGLEAAMDLSMLHQRRHVVDVILKAGATSPGPDSYQPLLCAAISAAAKRLLVDDVRALAGLAPTNTAYIAGFRAAVSSGDQWLTPDGLAVAKVFLDSDASGAEVDEAFCKAAMLYQRDAVELLAYSASPEALDKALQHVITYSAEWQSPKSFWLLQLILELGLELKAGVGSADWALLEAVRAYTEGNASEDLVDLLLTVGAHADVNFDNGQALKIAARAGHAPLLEKLIASGAGKGSKTEAFHTIITGPLGEDQVMTLLDVLFKCDGGPETRCDVNATLQEFPPIVACLSAHPHSTKLLKRLIKLGCQLEVKFQWTIYPENGIGPEPVTVLQWAMGHEKITTEPIEALIDSKANVNVVTPASESTPLIIAVKYGRKDIVRKLVAAKANVASRDRLDRSALFYASRLGDVESSKELIGAKSSFWDGSLHEAARNLHSNVVALLIKGKHDVNLRSSRHSHEGRTALQEMVYKCDGAASSARLEQTMLALAKGKADALAKHSVTGKNALFLALDNPHPYAVTLALLDIVMCHDIEDEKNMVELDDPATGTRHSYSPTMYIMKRVYRGDEAQGRKVLQLLREKGCPDRFFAHSGPQPSDAVGMPDKIRKAEEKRKDEEERRRRKEAEVERNAPRQKNVQGERKASLR